MSLTDRWVEPSGQRTADLRQASLNRADTGTLLPCSPPRHGRFTGTTSARTARRWWEAPRADSDR